MICKRLISWNRVLVTSSLFLFLNAILLCASAQKPHRNNYAEVVSLRIEGNYVSKATEGSDDSCDISVQIIKVKNLYRYKLSVSGTTYKGILKVLSGEKPEARYIIFTGITWSLNEGDISQLNEDQEPQSLKLPVGVRGVLLNDEIIIQNTGNAMNHYVQIDACDQKYIRMVKQ